MATDTIDVKRYDRQIRLWGLDTQRGLLGTRILLLRATGLCNEAAKNLVLAGVGHVSIQDSGIITADDLASGAVFSMRKTDIGRNKAEAMVEHLQPLNPSVDMAAVTQPLESLTDDFRRQFQYIIGTHGVEGVHEVGQCVTRLSTEAAATADGSRKRPREATGDDPEAKGSNGAHVLVPMRKTEPLPKMLAAGAPGMFGFLALDLLHQQHTVVTKLMTKATAGVPAPVSSRYQVAYPTIADAFGVAWNSLQPRSPPLYCALQLLLSAKTPGEVEALRASKLAEAGLSETFLTPPLSAEFVAKVGATASTELAPVCAIMGGMVAAEVIKIISGKDAPINNLFFLDAATTSDAAGITVRYGPAFQTELGVNKGQPQLIAEE